MRKYGAGLFIVALLGASGFAAAGIASKVARFGPLQITTTGTNGTVTLPTTAPTVPTGGEEGRGQEKVTLCHRPPGNPGNAHEITVGAPAMSAHLGHGDTLGPCPSVTTTVPTTTSTVGTTDSGADKVTICHRPPGNPDNARTITVGEPAVSAHLGHGDTAGACPTQTADSTAQTAGGDRGNGKGKGKAAKAGKKSGNSQGQGNGNGNGQSGGNGQGNEQRARGRQGAPTPAAEPPRGRSQGGNNGKGKGPGGKPRLLSWIYAWVV